MSHSESVRVCVRIRPVSSKEKQDDRKVVVFADKTRGEITVKNPSADDKEPPKSFTFDATFPSESTQYEVYNGAATDIVESVMNGFNGTIFAYGQTGAGKSHTMEGLPEPANERGIIPNSFKHIFDKVHTSSSTKQFLVRASYLEIYNEEIRDLLSKDPKNKLELKENADKGVYVKDLSSFIVKDATEIDFVMQSGKKNRSVGATMMNQTSSRSHSMFLIVVECSYEEHIHVGKLNLVDLAGSERQSKTKATGDRLKEATKINLSLSALGNVISALVDGKSSHIPYRDSKLTRLLQDSLGGNAKTVMIANCGPVDFNYEETLSTLRYANRAKNIKNKPTINEDPKDAMLREYQDEIQRLKSQLQAQQEKGGSGGSGSGDGISGKRKKEVVIEKIVVKREGLSEEELKKYEELAAAQKNEFKKKAQADLKVLLAEHNKTEEERKILEIQLKAQEDEKNALAKAKESMIEKLHQMQAELIDGGQEVLMDESTKQEAALRTAQRELEERKRQEILLARELAEKEESNINMGDQFNSLQDEVEIKTKKLKKLWAKHKAALTEITDLQREFQTEREDMLDTIRELSRQIKLKQLITENFIPKELVLGVSQRAQWNEELENWILSKIQNWKPKQKSTIDDLKTPETLFTRQRKLYDTKNTRYKKENIIMLELDMPERTTQDYEGQAIVQRVKQALDAALASEEDEILFEAAPQNLPVFQTEENIDIEEKKRPKSALRRSSSSKSKSGSSRTISSSSSSRKKKDFESTQDDESPIQEKYPTARGLVSDL